MSACQHVMLISSLVEVSNSTIKKMHDCTVNYYIVFLSVNAKHILKYRCTQKVWLPKTMCAAFHLQLLFVNLFVNLFICKIYFTCYLVTFLEKKMLNLGGAQKPIVYFLGCQT